jgi:hypothetical protein
MSDYLFPITDFYINDGVFSMSRHKDIRSLTYSLDLQMPGIYFWCGNFIIQIGGTEVDDEPYYYPFIVPTFIGFGIVLTDDLSWHTPFDQFKQRSC